MGNFKVGDKVVPVSKSVMGSLDSSVEWEQAKGVEQNFLYVNSFEDGYILCHHRQVDYSSGDYFAVSDLKLYSDKPSKKQRITALENEASDLGKRTKELEKEVSELKLIVHELRERKVVEPSTIDDVLQKESVEIIEFEGAKYRKVDRKACEGDVVIFDNVQSFDPNTVDGKPYKIDSSCWYKNDSGRELMVYGWNSRCPNPEVYEPITEPSTTTTVEDELKSSNQLRAEVIEKAKGFVEEHGEGWEFSTVPKIGRTIAYNLHELLSKIGESKCNPSDVFNEHIGKAIALGRALGLDVSEFEQAVQPNEFAKGQIIKADHAPELGNHEIIRIKHNSAYFTKGSSENFHYLSRVKEDRFHIINDTNAIYGGVE